MKKRGIFAVLLVAAFMLTACASNHSAQLSIMRYDSCTPSHLVWNNMTYDFYGAILYNGKTVGAQIGRIENEDDSKVFEVENESPKDWLVVMDGFMSAYNLYKQESVTNVPSGLKKIVANNSRTSKTS